LAADAPLEGAGTEDDVVAEVMLPVQAMEIEASNGVMLRMEKERMERSWLESVI